MNKKYLLSSVTAGIALLYANQGMAQDCVQSQDCASLGYTETSCTSGGVKCPFGDKWACYPEPDNSVVCEVGTLYYSDGSCYNEKVDDKTLLGVVIYADGAGGGWIMTVQPVATSIIWGGYSTNIPELTDYYSAPTDIQASCTNTDIITAKGSSSIYPAAWAAKNYKPSGTPSGKTWCLPSGGLLNAALNNSINLAKVNAGITAAGGTIIGGEDIWSSSEYSNYYAWRFTVYEGGSFFGMGDYSKSHNNDYSSVRPVMEF